MKKIFNPQTYIFLFSFMMLSFVSAFVYAQDSSGSSSQTTTTTTANTTTVQPWVWVVGGVVLLLIIIALVRGGGSKGRTDSVTYTKTTNSENNP